MEAGTEGGFERGLLLKVLALLVAVIATVPALRAWHLTSRASLKTDLEILRLLDAAHPNREAVSRKVDDVLHRLYSPGLAFWKRMLAAIPGFLAVVGFAY